MKRSEILYNAMSGISEDKIADAYEYRGYNKKREILHNILKGAGISAIFCSFIVLSLVLLKISGPKITTDPFTASTGTADSGVVTPDESETENVYTDIDDDSFYGMSKEEAYEKYGIVSFISEFNFDNCCDGEYLYSTYSTKEGVTLGRRKYPTDNSLTVPACTDPLCKHKSGCPFYNMNVIHFACYEGKIYFPTTDGPVRIYDKKTNKSIDSSITDVCMNPIFLKYNGNLYFHYTTETEEYSTVRKFYKISPSGEITKLGELSDIYSDHGGIIYNDSCYIDYKTETVGDKEKITVLERNFITGDVKNIAEIETSRKISEFDNVFSYMLYNDKLLICLDYHRMADNAEDRVSLNDIWLLDLTTGEKRLVCTPDVAVYGTNNVWCLFSQKCVMWQEPRLNEDDPLILHVLFPHTGQEKTYDLSKTVKEATGEDIPLDAYILDNAYSAVRLRTVINERSYIFCEIDLENGNVRKYQISPE